MQISEKELDQGSQNKQESGSLNSMEITPEEPAPDPKQKMRRMKKLVKFGQGLVIGNLICSVLVLFYLMAFYTLIQDDWTLKRVGVLCTFIGSDLLLAAQMLISVWALIQQSNILRLCIAMNVTSVFGKFISIILMVTYNPQFYLLAPALMMVFQLVQAACYWGLTKRWHIVPQKKWKKHLILVRKPKQIGQI